MINNKRKRDHCTICKAAGRNALGHEDMFCAYEDGPYAGKFKEAVAAKKASKRRPLANENTDEVVSLAHTVETHDTRLLGAIVKNFAMFQETLSNDFKQLEQTVAKQRNQIRELTEKVKTLESDDHQGYDHGHRSHWQN